METTTKNTAYIAVPLPIKVEDDTIGAADASGAPGGAKDEVCIQAGLDKVSEQLK